MKYKLTPEYSSMMQISELISVDEIIERVSRIGTFRVIYHDIPSREDSIEYDASAPTLNILPNAIITHFPLSGRMCLVATR